MLDIAVTIMSISSLTLATDMIIYLINGKGMFPYAEDVKYMRYVYGILSAVTVGAFVVFFTRSKSL